MLAAALAAEEGGGRGSIRSKTAPTTITKEEEDATFPLLAPPLPQIPPPLHRPPPSSSATAGDGAGAGAAVGPRSCASPSAASTTALEPTEDSNSSSDAAAAGDGAAGGAASFTMIKSEAEFEAMLASMRVVLRPRKARLDFTGDKYRGKSGRFLVVNHENIPCCVEMLRQGVKATPVRYTIVRPMLAGFGVAPQYPGVPAPLKKPLTRLVMATSVHADPAMGGGGEGTKYPVMQMWSYVKADSNEKKGDRVEELSWHLEMGNTVTHFINAEDTQKLAVKRALGAVGDKFEPPVPEGIRFIPAFTMCMVVISPRAEEYVRDGHCLRVDSVKPAPFSLYSIMADLALLPTAMHTAKVRQMEFVDKCFPCLGKSLDTTNSPFLSRVGPDAVIDETEAMATGGGSVLLMNWSPPEAEEGPRCTKMRVMAAANPEEGDGLGMGGVLVPVGSSQTTTRGGGDDEWVENPPCIEIPVETLLRYTNTTNVPWACSMLRAAIAMGALSVLVFSSDFWSRGGGTGHRAVPLVHVDLMLAAVTAETARAEFARQKGARTSASSSSWRTSAMMTTMLEGREMMRFPTAHTTTLNDSDGPYRIEVLVSVNPAPVSTGPPPACHDMPLCGRHVRLASAHEIRIDCVNVGNPDGLRVPSVWRGYYNVSPVNAMAAMGGGDPGVGEKRQRLFTMAGDDSVPPWVDPALASSSAPFQQQFQGGSSNNAGGYGGPPQQQQRPQFDFSRPSSGMMMMPQQQQYGGNGMMMPGMMMGQQQYQQQPPFPGGGNPNLMMMKPS